VNPGEEVTDYREELTGATPEKLANAPPLERVRAIVVQILLGKAVQTRREHIGVKHLLIGHSVEHDLEALDIKWKKGMQRDTAQFPLYLRHTHLPFKLRSLAEQFLGEKIQEEGQAHDPCIDARISMRLYQAAKRRDHGIARRWFDITLKERLVVPDDATNDPNDGIELLRRTIDHNGATHTNRFYCWCQDRGARARAGPPSPQPADFRRGRTSAKRSPDKNATRSSSSSASSSK
jgi:RNA exonuclease 4